MKLFTSSQVIEQLKQACHNAGSQKTWAKRHGISEPYVSDVLFRRRQPGGKILSALGFVREVKYIRATKAE